MFLGVVFTSIASGTISLDFATDDVNNVTTNPPSDGIPDVTEGFINDAKFIWNEAPGGTGGLLPIVRMQEDSTHQEGYNTSGRPVPFSEMDTTANFTRDAQLGAVPIVVALDENNVATNYYEFVLDVNQSNSTNTSGISIDEIQIYTSPTASQTTTTVSSLGTLRYDLDAGGMPGNEILLDHKLLPGSGTTDMIMLVPVSNFAGASATDYIYLYSSFGASTSSPSGQPAGFWETNAGFEEWAFKGDSVFFIPEPSNALVAGLICSLCFLRRSRPRSL